MADLGALNQQLSANLAKAKESSKRISESEGKHNREFGSQPTVGKSGSKNPGVLGVLSKAKDQCSKTGENYSEAPAGNPKDPDKKDDNAQAKVIEKHDSEVKKAKATAPTVASQDPGPILEAMLKADPGNVVGAVQKSLQAMMMVKMMDKLTSPAGIASMAAGAMGGGLGGLAKAVGVGAMLGGLGAAMPALQGALSGSVLGALNTGMQGMVSGNPVGALASTVVQEAAGTVAAVTSAVASLDPAYVIGTAAVLGGPALGLTPGSLAHTIALTTPGNVIKTSALIRGVAIASTLEVVDSFMHDKLGDIPKLMGDEHVGIAMAHIPVMERGIGGAVVGTLHEAGMIPGELAGPYISGAVGAISGGLAGAVGGALSGGNIGGVLGGALGGAIGGAIGGGVAGIVDGGLNKILGGPLSGLTGMASKLLPNIGGNILGTIAAHASIPSVGAAMQQATKALGLAAKGFQVTKMFGDGLPEQVANLHDSMVAGVVKNAINGAIQGAVQGAVAGAISNAFPTTMVAQCNGVRITVTAGRVSPATAIAAGAIAGAFSRL